MAFDVLVRALFSDQGLSVGLAKANAGLANLGKSGPAARRGLAALEIGMRQMAFQAVGLSGGLGQVARGLLMFGGGSALVLGAAAGLGAIGLAYRHLTRDTKAAKEEQEKFVQGLAAIGPNAKALTERMKLGDLQAQLMVEQLNVARSSFGASSESPETIRLQRAIATQTNILAQAEREATEATARARRQITAEQERANKAAAERLRMEGAEGLRILSSRGAFIRGERPIGGIVSTQQLPGMGEEQAHALLVRAGLAVPELRTAGLDRMDQAGREATARADLIARSRAMAPSSGFRLSPEFGVMSAMALMQGVQSGNVGGFISAAAGPVGMLNPLAGAITAGVGGIFSLFDNSQERRHKELIQTLKDQLRPLAFPERISLNVVGDPNSVLPGAERSARRDAVNRTASRA